MIEIDLHAVPEEVIIAMRRETMDAEMYYRRLTDEQRALYTGEEDFVERWLAKLFKVKPL